MVGTALVRDTSYTTYLLTYSLTYLLTYLLTHLITYLLTYLLPPLQCQNLGRKVSRAEVYVKVHFPNPPETT